MIRYEVNWLDVNNDYGKLEFVDIESALISYEEKIKSKKYSKIKITIVTRTICKEWIKND